jgi:hypothetical protein
LAVESVEAAMNESAGVPVVDSIGPNAIIEVSPDVIAQRLGDETILVHLDTNLMFDLNRTASRLWELAQSRLSRRQIEEILCQEFLVDREELACEVGQLLRLLRERELVRIHP